MGTLAVRRGDDPLALARSFVETFHLRAAMCQEIVDRIKDHVLQYYLTAPEHPPGGEEGDLGPAPEDELCLNLLEPAATDPPPSCRGEPRGAAEEGASFPEGNTVDVSAIEGSPSADPNSPAGGPDLAEWEPPASPAAPPSADEAGPGSPPAMTMTPPAQAQAQVVQEAQAQAQAQAASGGRFLVPPLRLGAPSPGGQPSEAGPSLGSSSGVLAAFGRPEQPRPAQPPPNLDDETPGWRSGCMRSLPPGLGLAGIDHRWAPYPAWCTATATGTGMGCRVALRLAGRQGRIKVREESSPAELAMRFGGRHKLAPVAVERLERLIEQNIRHWTAQQQQQQQQQQQPPSAEPVVARPAGGVAGPSNQGGRPSSGPGHFLPALMMSSLGPVTPAPLAPPATAPWSTPPAQQPLPPPPRPVPTARSLTAMMMAAMQGPPTPARPPDRCWSPSVVHLLPSFCMISMLRLLVPSHLRHFVRLVRDVWDLGASNLFVVGFLLVIDCEKIVGPCLGRLTELLLSGTPVGQNEPAQVAARTHTRLTDRRPRPSGQILTPGSLPRESNLFPPGVTQLQVECSASAFGVSLAENIPTKWIGVQACRRCNHWTPSRICTSVPVCCIFSIAYLIAIPRSNPETRNSKRSSPPDAAASPARRSPIPPPRALSLFAALSPGVQPHHRGLSEGSIMDGMRFSVPSRLPVVPSPTPGSVPFVTTRPALPHRTAARLERLLSSRPGGPQRHPSSRLSLAIDHAPDDRPGSPPSAPSALRLLLLGGGPAPEPTAHGSATLPPPAHGSTSTPHESSWATLPAIHSPAQASPHPPRRHGPPWPQGQGPAQPPNTNTGSPLDGHSPTQPRPWEAHPGLPCCSALPGSPPQPKNGSPPQPKTARPTPVRRPPPARPAPPEGPVLWHVQPHAPPPECPCSCACPRQPQPQPQPPHSPDATVGPPPAPLPLRAVSAVSAALRRMSSRSRLRAAHNNNASQASLRPLVPGTIAQRFFYLQAEGAQDEEAQAEAAGGLLARYWEGDEGWGGDLEGTPAGSADSSYSYYCDPAGPSPEDPDPSAPPSSPSASSSGAASASSGARSASPSPASPLSRVPSGTSIRSGPTASKGPPKRPPKRPSVPRARSFQPRAAARIRAALLLHRGGTPMAGPGPGPGAGEGEGEVIEEAEGPGPGEGHDPPGHQEAPPMAMAAGSEDEPRGDSGHDHGHGPARGLAEDEAVASQRDQPPLLPRTPAAPRPPPARGSDPNHPGGPGGPCPRVVCPIAIRAAPDAGLQPFLSGPSARPLPNPPAGPVVARQPSGPGNPR
ncbi:hypothetical protein PAPYR_822 [Paratrimastix pyriformis]|uniref:Uncharacterized protein n=1 Tax=Paratrimastix pyriformis TaxID=342808 RepID=A0ABQ8UYD7_9EUKA|nr:hypothetical protein PAPYR_822 [Paratrimastix pyriformis]